MTNDETMTELKAWKANARGVIRASSFRFPSSFVIRHSGFVILLRRRAFATLAAALEFAQESPAVPTFSIRPP